jgi:NAD(P)H-hydrate epimerase
MAGAAKGMVFAIDAPSGVDGATGLVEGGAIRADVTVTLCRAKQGLLLYPGRSYAGEIVVAPIGIPGEAIARVGGKTFQFEEENAAPLLPPRARDAHKGHFGRIVIAGGSGGLTGAPFLAGMAALRAGGGLVTLAVPRSLHPAYAGKVVELMTTPLPDEGGAHCREGARAFLDDSGRFDVIALGPGLARGDGPRGFVHELVGRWEGPMVIDADGLNALAGEEALLRHSPGPRILTPHMGEMVRLTGVDRVEIEKDRVSFVREWSERLGSVLLLKGNPTLVADTEGIVSINSTGNPGMATAGSGDVLTGAAAAFLGAGLGAGDAARLAVWIHGLAGDIAAKRRGEAGVVAGDLIDDLPSAAVSVEPRDPPA